MALKAVGPGYRRLNTKINYCKSLINVNYFENIFNWRKGGEKMATGKTGQFFQKISLLDKYCRQPFEMGI